MGGDAVIEVDIVQAGHLIKLVSPAGQRGAGGNAEPCCARGDIEAALGRGIECAQAGVLVELDRAEDIARIEKTIAVSDGLQVWRAIAGLIKAQTGALCVGGDDVEALSARACEDGIDLACSLKWIARPRNKFAAGGDGAIIGENVDVIDIEREAVMDNDAALYAAEEIGIEERCMCGCTNQTGWAKRPQ